MTGALDYRRAELGAAVFFGFCRPSRRDGTAAYSRRRRARCVILLYII